jgi:hypothetical protein
LFTAAAIDGEIWARAALNPRRYFEARGVRVPARITSRFVEYTTTDPGADKASDGTLVRCWWVTARDEFGDDDEPPTPLRFCVEMPASVAAGLSKANT